mmetsp:Transcript_1812/g.2598  ORF Transcript_1812/g.2598 Transcript_1812/m.2598 type:complete len:82 (+) Transcript_1812:441-686(+)
MVFDDDADDDRSEEELDQICEDNESVSGPDAPSRFIEDHQRLMLRDASDTQLIRCKSAKKKSDLSAPYESTTDGYQTRDSC